VLRVASALAMVLATALVYASATLLFDRRIGTIAGVLFAINPELIDFAQKARPYAMQTMFVALAFWGMVKVIVDDHARTRWITSGLWSRAEGAGRGAGANLGWGAYIVGAAAAMLTQHPGGFFVLSANVVALLRLLMQGRAVRLWFANWIIAQLLMFLLWALWLPGFVHQIGALITINTTTRNPVYFIDAGEMLGTILSLYSVSSVWTARYGAWAIYFVGFLLGLASLYRYRFSGIAVLVPATFPTIIGVIGFYTIHPIFGYVISTMHWILVPYVMIIAAGVGSIAYPLARSVAFGCFVLANAWGLRNYYETPNPPTDDLVATIAEQARPGDGIIFSEYTVPRFVVGYYLRPTGLAINGLDVTRDGAALIRSLDDARKNARNWVILAGGQRSAVDVAQLAGGRAPDFERDFGAYKLLRIDGPALP